jgi:hypothetical protein
VIALGIAYWYISVPVLVLTAIAVGVTVHRQHAHRAQGAANIATVPSSAAGSAVPVAVPPRAPRPASTPPLTMPADTFKVGSLVHLEKNGRRATYFVDHGRTPDEIVLKRVTSTPSVPDA